MTTSRKLISLIICVVCLFTLVLSGYAPANDSVDFENAQSVPLYKNGIRVSEGILLNGTTYVPLRSFSDAVGVEIEIAWDAETDTATVTGDGLTLSITVGQQYMTANGRCLYIPLGVFNYNGSVLVPVRELSRVYGVEVEWHEESSSISLLAENPEFIQPGDEFYVEEDLYWLSRIINSEAGNQPLDGKIGVGNVVLNRVADPTCPDTIYNVIFDRKYGVQFSVTTNGTIYNAPNDESIVAAKLCLEGYSIVEDAIYFVNPDIGVSSWFVNTRVFVATIGDHDFYA